MASPVSAPSQGQPPPAPLSPLWIVAGPTASGKSELALCLAERLNGEIVTVDSMQVYRGLDIGTAKPSAADQARVPHHLLDVVTLADWFDAAQFVHLATAAVDAIRSRGRTPILCGGTGLYFKAYLEGLSEAPPADLALRTELRSLPLSDLLRELAERDPATYERIDRNNPRRVIRALEVIRLTGKPFSLQRVPWQTAPPRAHDGAAVRAWCLTRDADDLRCRIDQRVDQMFQQGLVEETRRLLQTGLDQNLAAMQALGYRQVVEHLRGEHSLPETIELVKTRTRQFAKRQLTWFRRQLQLDWITLPPNQSLPALAESLTSAQR